MTLGPGASHSASAAEWRVPGDVTVSLVEWGHRGRARRDAHPFAVPFAGRVPHGLRYGGPAAAGLTGLPGRRNHRWLPEEGLQPIAEKPEEPL
ncbi:hypothetical protein NDU88_003303 [Pleurodeles waltl]|uniref:Uncharacterized protein n=1 Tax=Pleurodeles waltl TaxID=8319 RepID=A0AAV7T4E4_PLEWA|nr:hypothetical protein NDU88_003303 [Pleurodeles waltl]